MDYFRDLIEQHFGARVGRFLEIGAFDGLRDSLTYGLCGAGWSGVMVEPNPVNFIALQTNHGHNKLVSLVHAAVADYDGLAKFWDDGGGQVSSLSTRHRDAFVRDNQTVFSEYHTAVISVQTLLNTFGGPRNWQFVQIDAEGTSVSLLRRLPLAEMLDTELLCVEWDTPSGADIRAITEPYYDVLVERRPNTLLVRKKP